MVITINGKHRIFSFSCIDKFPVIFLTFTAPPTISGTRMPSSRSRENEKENDSDTSGSSNIENVGEDETIGDRIVNALERLQQDMRMVILRLNSIEDRIKAATQVRDKEIGPRGLDWEQSSLSSHCRVRKCSTKCARGIL